jgi:hypothetical protein
MARPNSSATGNYIATPTRAVPWIGRLLRLETSLSARQRPSDQRRMMTVVDPCAADGAAIFGVMQAAYGELVGAPIDFNLIEMEATRHAALVRAATSPEIAVRAPAAILHGDAICVGWETAFARQGASVLYLNPPYEPDATYGVLEARWLQRFMGVLCVGGVLLFVIPGGSLRPCAEMLARHLSLIHI